MYAVPHDAGSAASENYEIMSARMDASETTQTFDSVLPVPADMIDGGPLPAGCSAIEYGDSTFITRS